MLGHAVVVGGGPAGLLTAIRLVNDGFAEQVTLLEDSQHPHQQHSSYKQFFISLTERGLKPTKAVPGLTQKLRSSGFTAGYLYMHRGMVPPHSTEQQHNLPYLILPYLQ